MTDSIPPGGTSAARRLRLLRGGRVDRWRHGRLEVVAAPPGSPPFPVARRVVEEDRWRVVGASPEWCPPPPEPAVRLYTELVFDAPAEPGRLLRRGRRWHAVVVDLDAEPLVDPDAVARAWGEVAARCAREGITRLAVPLLGSVHGDLAPGAALRLLHAGLLARPPAGLRRVWIETRLRHRVVVEQALAGWAAGTG